MADHRWLWVALGVAVPVLAVSTVLATRGVDDREIAMFQAVNGLPNGIRPYLWVVNQYGTAITIPIATAIALAGVPSGHDAVAFAITIVVLVTLGWPWRTAAIVLAIAVPMSRMYVAAHLPLDLIDGAALGVMVASAVCLLVARRTNLG